MRTIGYRSRRFLFIPLILVAISAFSAVAMVLWNELMTLIFHLPTITFWQALGLLILGRLFFGGGRPFGRWGRNDWRSGFQERISKMSAEEREEFFRRMRHCRHTRHTETPGEKKAVESDNTE